MNAIWHDSYETITRDDKIALFDANCGQTQYGPRLTLDHPLDHPPAPPTYDTLFVTCPLLCWLAGYIVGSF